ncbi:hypothetical protein OJJOAM_002105 [Cupriavidus sp. H18C1]
MARRVALARAIALDPSLLMYDEPFAGLDPISLGLTARLIRTLNDALGATTIIVSHDVHETFQIADYVYFIAEGRIAAEGGARGAASLHRSLRPPVRACRGRRPGAVPLRRAVARRGLRRRGGAVMGALYNAIAMIGSAVRQSVEGLGMATRMFLAMLAMSPSMLRRFRLVSDQIFFVGNLSLVIIAVSGLFVGFVLGLQGYYTLNRYGSEQALGLLVALSLVRELGPVVTALLFAGRAGTSLTAEIGLMKAGEQLTAMEMMAVNPLQRVVAPRFWAGVIAMPVLAAIFSAVGILGGYIVGVQLIGVDAGAFWSQMQGGVDVRDDVLNGVIKSFIFGIAVTFIALYQGYEAKPTPEGVSRATTRTVVIASLAVLGLDFLLTALMFST